MRLYRVENELGEGMYRNGIMHGFLDAYDRDHPGPGDDAVLRKHFDDHDGFDIVSPFPRFGFASLEQAKEWVHPHWVTHLADHGMTVAVYDAALYAHGDRQSIFAPETATLVERLPIYVLHPRPDQLELPL